MSLFDALNFLGGLSLFLFGMTVMGQALERRAGSSLKLLLSKLTTNKITGLITGLGVTAAIQSSSATTVMVVGFVNSGLMSLKQAINVIMGANIGTTVTAWILSLSGIDSDNFLLSLLKPSSFTPVLALIGIGFFMISKNDKRKETGMIFLGFATLMFGMSTMSNSVAGLKDIPEFREMFVTFTNPILGMITGAVLTAIIQSSSASIGILQALSSTGIVSYGLALPIIMGQNIGTCITAIMSSVGTSKNAKRAAWINLSFNLIGAIACLIIFYLAKATLSPLLFNEPASLMGIALFHSAFNILCTIIIFPLTGILEKLICRIIPDATTAEKNSELDERLLGSPALALSQSRQVLNRMAQISVDTLKLSLDSVMKYDPKLAQQIREQEAETDRLEDVIGTYILQLTSRQLNEYDSFKATKFMKLIGDYERIGDHAINILEAAEEINSKGIKFSPKAQKEYLILKGALSEILDLSYQAFVNKDSLAAKRTEPLEQVIDELKETLRTRHILRMQKGECSIDAGSVWSDILTNIERVSDHCSNISGSVLDNLTNNLNVHEGRRALRRTTPEFVQEFNKYTLRYDITDED